MYFGFLPRHRSQFALIISYGFYKDKKRPNMVPSMEAITKSNELNNSRFIYCKSVDWANANQIHKKRIFSIITRLIKIREN